MDLQWSEADRAFQHEVRAFIEAKRDVAEAPSEQDLTAFASERLAKYKVPATIVVTDSIPRTASGKVQKHVLRARALDEMGGENA